jgi:hypothetical protein
MSRGEDTVAARFRELKVVLRSVNGDERAWMVEVDTGSRPEDLLPELVQALPIEGEPEEYELRNEGPLDEPILVLIAKPHRHVGRIRDLGT